MTRYMARFIGGPLDGQVRSARGLFYLHGVIEGERAPRLVRYRRVHIDRSEEPPWEYHYAEPEDP